MNFNAQCRNFLALFSFRELIKRGAKQNINRAPEKSAKISRTDGGAEINSFRSRKEIASARNTQKIKEFYFAF
jgi:hypothetical protein